MLNHWNIKCVRFPNHSLSSVAVDITVDVTFECFLDSIFVKQNGKHKFANDGTRNQFYERSDFEWKGVKPRRSDGN